MFRGGSSAVNLAIAFLTMVPVALWLGSGKPHAGPLQGKHVFCSNRRFCPSEDGSRETRNNFAWVSTAPEASAKSTDMWMRRKERNMWWARVCLSWILSSQPCAHHWTSWLKWFPQSKLNPFWTLFTQKAQNCKIQLYQELTLDTLCIYTFAAGSPSSSGPSSTEQTKW